MVLCQTFTITLIPQARNSLTGLYRPLHIIVQTDNPIKKVPATQHTRMPILITANPGVLMAAGVMLFVAVVHAAAAVVDTIVKREVVDYSVIANKNL